MRAIIERINIREPTSLEFGLLLSGISILGIVVILLSTRWGLGLSDDSYVYLRPARQFQDSGAYSLSRSFPPLLPLIVLISGYEGQEQLKFLRAFNSILFAGVIILTGVIVSDLTRSRIFGVIAALLILLSPVMIEAFSWALSEALFLFLLLASVYSLARYFSSRQSTWLVIGGLLSALVVATRYAGIGLVLGVDLVLLLRPATKWRIRLGGPIAFTALSLSVISVFLIRDAAAASSITGHGQFVVENIRWIPSQAALYNMFTWFVPGRRG